MHKVKYLFYFCLKPISFYKGVSLKLEIKHNYSSSKTNITQVAVECVSAFAMDVALQSSLYQQGVMWHLLIYLFNYDFTLEEGGVRKSEESNQQEVANRLARLFEFESCFFCKIFS